MAARGRGAAVGDRAPPASSLPGGLLRHYVAWPGRKAAGRTAPDDPIARSATRLMRLMSPTIARIMRSEVDQLTRLKSDLEKSA